MKQFHPQCDGHQKLARTHVVKDLMKPSYSRPFFVCSDKTNPCSYWVWGDVQPITKPECCHGSCLICKVKKEGLNKDHRFFCSPNLCRFFEWVADEPIYVHYRGVNVFNPPLEKPSLEKPLSEKPSSEKPLSEKPTEHYLTTEFINDFANNLNICFLSGVVRLYVTFYIYMNKVFHLLYSVCCCVCNESDLRRVV